MYTTYLYTREKPALHWKRKHPGLYLITFGKDGWRVLIGRAAGDVGGYSDVLETA